MATQLPSLSHGFSSKQANLVRNAQSGHLDLMHDESDAMGTIVGASVTYYNPGQDSLLAGSFRSFKRAFLTLASV